MGNRMAKMAVLALLILLTGISHAGTVPPEIQTLLKIRDEAEEKMAKGEAWDVVPLEKTVRVLVDKCVETQGAGLWEKRPEGELSFMCLLSVPDLKRGGNPFRDEALWYYLKCKASRGMELPSREEDMLHMLEMLNDDDFKASHSSIGGMLYKSCSDRALLSDAVIKKLNAVFRKRLARDADHRHDSLFKLLFLLDSRDIEADNLDRLREESLKCRKFYYGTDLPFIALVFLAQNGDRADLLRFLGLLHDCGRLLPYDTAWRLFPYVSLVRKREAVMMLGEYLKSETVIDQGDDVRPRYTGYSLVAAASLSIMLKDFPQFNFDDYKAEDRERYVAWLEQHRDYEFNGPTDWKWDNFESNILSYTRNRIFR